jgi:hypothetical protein
MHGSCLKMHTCLSVEHTLCITHLTPASCSAPAKAAPGPHELRAIQNLLTLSYLVGVVGVSEQVVLL